MPWSLFFSPILSVLCPKSTPEAEYISLVSTVLITNSSWPKYVGHSLLDKINQVVLTSASFSFTQRFRGLQQLPFLQCLNLRTMEILAKDPKTPPRPSKLKHRKHQNDD